MTIKACQINANTASLTAVFLFFCFLWSGQFKYHLKDRKVAYKTTSQIFDLRGFHHFQSATLSPNANELSNINQAQFLWKTKTKKTSISAKDEEFHAAKLAQWQLHGQGKKAFRATTAQITHQVGWKEYEGSSGGYFPATLSFTE